ncbi:hypothetical protein PYW08_011594 [Mythimna loreyi]|uniref:Uncharacterized protein n=1 Tax=Mythimna loreyi TaxID=667449 RepID=A0ACC2QJV0_9NEOP|nr:hypothetical protein PYW08_011594 [Mythimna loreyi]
MRTEVLELRRACFCLPLRYSLLFYGYLRLICIVLDMFMTVSLAILESNTTSIIYLQIFTVILDLLDFILLVILIVGAHKKSVKLLKIFYFYDLGLLILETLVCIAFAIYILCILIMLDGFERAFKYNAKIMLSVAAYLTIYLGLKVYVLLLVRSEIIKLNNNSQFRFVNIAAESECEMECKKTGDEEQGLANNDNEPFEIKEDYSDRISKLKIKVESNMNYKKLGDVEIETEKIDDEETCKSGDIS